MIPYLCVLGLGIAVGLLIGAVFAVLSGAFSPFR